DWLDRKLYQLDPALPDDPGRVTIHRLNRLEYNNTVRDLLGIDFRPADDFPSDDVGYGFNNIADVLSLPPLLLEKYVDASEQIAQAVILVEPMSGQKVRVGAEQLGGAGGQADVSDGFRVLTTAGAVFCQPEVKVAGRYIIRVEALADQAGPDPAKMEIRVAGKSVMVHDIQGQRKAATYEVQHALQAGRCRIEAAFVNDYYNPEAPDPAQRDRNLGVRYIELQGPLDAPEPETHRRIVFTKPSETKSLAEATREIFSRLMPRAFRRPVLAAELQRVADLAVSVAEQESSFERGIQVGLQAVLVSPHFLFRIETDERPDDPNAHHPLNDFELASRLSYFLWSSMPDERLFELAGQGVLHETEILDQQLARMLSDPKSDALAENFATQWLNVGNLVEVQPDAKRFPTFTPELRMDMIRETQLVARTIFREDRSLLDFLDADFTFVNRRLARHYGWDVPAGDGFQKVMLPPGQRRGVLTHASILTLTSNPDRTSIVKRGKWILDNVLGLELPEPPANIPTLEEGAKASGAKTLREQLKMHRDSPDCSSCHRTLDPLGFGLENFDAIGRWREESEGEPVDASGTMPGLGSFSGPVELVQVLKRNKDDFAELVTRKMLTYALGRGLEVADSRAVDKIATRLRANDYRFSALVGGIVHSQPFLNRRGEGGEKR
ncbi:MAG: DUF1592 domain-containing protein, partial [Planctomycetes bacterium]|nr:DUF1592 domain-containing protein [Planctomycetota bacterium]